MTDRSARRGRGEFGILPEQIGFDRFQHLQEAEDGGISACKVSTLVILVSSVNGPLPSSPTPIVAAPAVTAPFFKKTGASLAQLRNRVALIFSFVLLPQVGLKMERA